MAGVMPASVELYSKLFRRCTQRQEPQPLWTKFQIAAHLHGLDAFVVEGRLLRAFGVRLQHCLVGKGAGGAEGAEGAGGAGGAEPKGRGGFLLRGVVYFP